jgi:hypothetical protein
MLHNKNRHPHHTTPIRNHVRAHEEITSNELWYGDQPPSLGPGFTAAKTRERTSTVVGILLRAAKRADKTGSTEGAAHVGGVAL